MIYLVLSVFIVVTYAVHKSSGIEYIAAGVYYDYNYFFFTVDYYTIAKPNK